MNGRRVALLVALALGAVVMAACARAESAGPGASPSSSAPPSSSPQSSLPAALPTDGELTAELDLAVNPPAPAEVRVVSAARGRVELAWAPPPAVAIAHHYSDTVTAYRIYRQGPGDVEPLPVGRTADLAWVDTSAQAAGRYSYVVASVRSGDLEGTRSAPAAVATIS